MFVNTPLPNTNRNTSYPALNVILYIVLAEMYTSMFLKKYILLVIV